MPYQNISVEPIESFLILTINRPDKLNALSAPTLSELEAAVKEAGNDASLRGMIITGAGSRAFVAGADISEFQGLDAEGARQLAARGHRIFDAIENLPFPVIAAVNGYALGGGCELAMACHMRVGSDKAILGLPEAGLGLIPGYGGTQRLTRYVGKAKAIELMVTTDMLSADKALALGLLNYVVQEEELMEKCLGILRKSASKGPVAVRRILACSNAYYNKGVNGFQEEIDSFGELFSTSDVIEGTTAFLEKRKPEFKGK